MSTQKINTYTPAQKTERDELAKRITIEMLKEDRLHAAFVQLKQSRAFAIPLLSLVYADNFMALAKLSAPQIKHLHDKTIGEAISKFTSRRK